MTHITRVPDVKFQTRIRDESVDADNPFRWKESTTEEVFAGKKIVVLALPGAFTPTCSSTHLPRYEELYEVFKQQGLDEIICISVNDAFVMYNWAKSLGIKKVKMLPDGNADFTRKMGMLVDKSNLGFGMRSWRYAMVVDDREIQKVFIAADLEDNCPTDPFMVSDADTVLGYLKGA